MDYHRFLSEHPRTYLGRGLPDRPHVCLTFDDGPGDATPALLDRLHALGITATFFCTADAAARRPDLVRTLVADGHDLGSHGRVHRDLSTLTVDAFWNDHVRPAARELAAIAGRSVTLFRPPYGEIAPDHVGRLAQAGHTVVGWSIDPRDWADSLAPDHVDRVVRKVTEGIHPGAIVLLHDGDDGDAPRSAILPIVERLVPNLRQAGYVFVGVTDMLRRRDVATTATGRAPSPAATPSRRR